MQQDQEGELRSGQVKDNPGLMITTQVFLVENTTLSIQPNDEPENKPQEETTGEP